jgi:hypothetical protein
MSVYKNVLPNAFPYCLVLPIHEARRYVKLLLSNRTDVPQGSSFAVTVDNWDGTWNLWVSEASYKFLKEHGPLDIEPIRFHGAL